MSRVAAVDCGTNSIRLLIAEHGTDGALVDCDRRLEIVRLGQGVDETGEFHPEALLRTFAAVDSYAEAIAAAEVATDNIRFVATSAARDAGNRAELAAGIRSRLGVSPEVISGQVEAQLSFTGALSRVSVQHSPVLVIDIGGGSTELVLGSAVGEIAQSASLEIGSVRITERFLTTSPPRPADLQRATRQVDDLLASSEIEFGAVGTWIGVAGTVTTLASLYLGLDRYDRHRVHGSAIPTDQLAPLLARLSALSADEIRATFSIHPQRADVITAGALIATRVAAVVSAGELLVSESDILDGIALSLLNRPTR